MREFIRRGINQHTLEKICTPIHVRASKMAKALKVLQQWESEQDGLRDVRGRQLRPRSMNEMAILRCDDGGGMKWHGVPFS